MTRLVERPAWDDYYLGIAAAVSSRGDCVRAQHGCVIVQGDAIISTGYNGTPPGDTHSCGESGECPRVSDPEAKHSQGNYDMCWATHAEANAIMRADWTQLKGATAYVTGLPCPGCMKLLRSARVARVYSFYGEMVL